MMILWSIIVEQLCIWIFRGYIIKYIEISSLVT
jgi:hypothetical protein